MDPSAGRREVRERVVRLLTVVVTTSSVVVVSIKERQQLKERTNEMFEDDSLVTVLRFGGLPHLHTLAHLPISIAESHKR